MIKELLNKDVNIKMEQIDFHECRFMGNLVTYDVTLMDKDFCYKKSVLHKVYGGSSVLPIDKEGNVLLEIQYRFPIRQPILELPAGRSEKNETFFDSAKRELKEETGYDSNEVINQLEFFAQPEFTDERLASFVALNCEKIGEQSLDFDESVTLIAISFEDAIELVKKNIIIDERTIISIGIAKCIQNLSFSNIKGDINCIKEKIYNEGMKLEEKEVDIDYMKPCEFGFVKDHIVKVPGDKNSRRECFYMKPEEIVLPISKNGKIGFIIRYMPCVKKNMIEFPCKLDFDKNVEFESFGEMVTAVGYANDRQYMSLVNNLDETDEFIWFTREEVLELIKSGIFEDGRVVAAVLKYLL